jgi:tetratricopeptide (TPR) repeat protein
MLFANSILLAQYENLLHKPYAVMAPDMHKIFGEILKSKDSTVFTKKIDKIKKFAIQHKDKHFELEIDLFELFAKSNFYKKDTEQSIRAYKALMKRAEQEHVWHVKLNTTRALAEYYWKFVKDYELAFEYYLMLDKELIGVKSNDYPQMARDYNQIGESYFFFRDFSRAKKYFKKVILLQETIFNTNVRASAFNTIGLCYQREKNYDSSNFYFRKVLETKFENTKNAWIGIIKGNLGANFYKQKNYDEAIPLLKFCIEKAKKDYDSGSLSGASIVLAAILLKQNKLQEAWKYIEQAQKSIGNTGNISDYKHLYPILSSWYSKNRKDELAELYLDSTMLAISKYEEDFNAIKIVNAQNTINKKEKLLMKATLDLEKQEKINERNGMLLIVLVLCVIMLTGWFLLKRNRQKMELRALKVENRLKLAHQYINQFKERVNAQNKLLDQVKKELSQIKKTNSENTKLVERSIFELRSMTILTDDDWIQFKQNFSLIYPSFFVNLTTKFPLLTDAEMRYLMLAKLQLSHKEMARILGVSFDSVRVTWNRARKKCYGNLEDTPQSLLEKIEN